MKHAQQNLGSVPKEISSGFFIVVWLVGWVWWFFGILTVHSGLLNNLCSGDNGLDTEMKVLHLWFIIL